MPTEVIMPALGMAQETGKVLRWHRAEGDSVAKGEPLLEVETDKVTVDVESPATGTLAGIRAAEGEDVPVGVPVAVVLAAGEALDETEPRPTASSPGAGTSEDDRPALRLDAARSALPTRQPRRRLASPKARRLAAARGVDVDALAGSGPSGAVVASDVEGLEEGAAPAAGQAPERLPVGPVWRLMAERTTQSWQSVPHFVLRREVAAGRLQSWREATRRLPGGERVTLTDVLVRLAAEALRRHPRVNASWRDGGIVVNERVNVAIAVATEDGLVAPVVHDADRLGLAGIAGRRQQLVAAARDGRLRLDDLAGGTFTISNLGMYGVDSFDAIVVAPQAAILAVGRIVERLVPVDGQATVRPMLGLTLSFDHRVVDGARGAEFLDTLAALVEEPAALVS